MTNSLHVHFIISVFKQLHKHCHKYQLNLAYAGGYPDSTHSSPESSAVEKSMVESSARERSMVESSLGSLFPWGACNITNLQAPHGNRLPGEKFRGGKVPGDCVQRNGKTERLGPPPGLTILICHWFAPYSIWRPPPFFCHHHHF